MKIADFLVIARLYGAAKNALADAKKDLFPRNTVVAVNCERFHGVGMVALEDGCPTDALCVLIENGNIWRYPVVACVPVTDRKQWPLWVRRRKRRIKRAENLLAKGSA